MSNELEQARVRIDEADRRMAALFEQRMAAVEDVLAYKRAHGLPALDAAREQAVLERNAAYIGEERFRPAYRAFQQAVMDASRAYQRVLLGRTRVAYQGVEGAFSHIALRRLFPKAEAVACGAFADVFAAVETGDAAQGVIPFENSYTGEVGEVLDLLFTRACAIIAVYDLPVDQHLLGVPGATLGDVRQVLSHPQAISQCREFLDRQGVEVVPYGNTALAARDVSLAGDRSRAAIASDETAQLYGLTVLARAINTRRDNTTRFIVIGPAAAGRGDRFSLAFTVDHKAGRLAAVMQIIAEMGFNLESIKSRPLKDLPWQYYFYVEVVGDIKDPRAGELLARLEQACSRLKVLGAYDAPGKQDRP